MIYPCTIIVNVVIINSLKYIYVSKQADV